MEYIGPDYVTPDFQWLTPVKDPRTPQDVVYSQSVGRIRVHIKQFFGWIITSFGVFQNTYQWSHKHFNTDFKVVCCLVNEHLEAAELNDNNYQAFHGL